MGSVIRREAEREHQNYNVYGAEKIEAVENAIGLAKDKYGAETNGEALVEIATAYTGISLDASDD